MKNDEKIKVLLIEDSLGDIRLISDMIEASGQGKIELNHNIRLSSAMERMSKFNYDAVILDLYLPDSSGIETLHTLRKEFKEIPIVVITEYTNQDLDLNAVKAGAQDFLIKGHFEDELLIRTLYYAIERKHQQKNLLEKTQLLETIFNSTHFLLAYLDTSFNFVRINQSFANVMGKEMSFFLRKNYFDLFPGKDFEEIFHQVSKTGEPHFGYSDHFLLTYYPNDVKKYFDWSLIPLKNNEEKVTGLILTLIDVSEQKRLTESLVDSEERYRLITENSRDLIAMLNEEGRYVYVSPSHQTILGYSPEFLLSIDPFTLIHPDDLHIFSNTKIVERVEFRGKKADGKWIWLEASNFVIDWRGKEYLVGVARDITERKEAEERLAISNVRFDGIIKSAMDAIISINESHQIILFNQAAESIFRIKASEAIGKNINDFVPLKFREIHKTHISNFGHTNVSTRSMGMLGTLTALKADGTEFPIEASISQVNVAGEKIYTVIIRDKSEDLRDDEATVINKSIKVKKEVAAKSLKKSS